MKQTALDILLTDPEFLAAFGAFITGMIIYVAVMWYRDWRRER